MPRLTKELNARRKAAVLELMRENINISNDDVNRYLQATGGMGGMMMSGSVQAELRRSLKRAAKRRERKARIQAPKLRAPVPADVERMREALTKAVEALHNAAQANGEAPRLAQLGLASVYVALLDDNHLPDLGALRRLIGGGK